MQPKINESLAFLKWFRPGGPWTLTSIVPNGKAFTKSFSESDSDKMKKWIETEGKQKRNIYFQVNNCGDELPTRKVSKEQIRRVEWLHVDVDPEGDQSQFNAERIRIEKALKAYAPKASLIIDSGGGFQGFWRLAEPLIVSEPTDWTEFERHNRQIELDLAGSTVCANVDRIMRLPGTVNVPNKTKLKKGRTEALATVVEKNDTVFDLDVFPQSPLLDGGQKGDAARTDIELSGNLPRLNDIDDLDEFGVSDYHKMLIVQGTDPDNPTKWPSRSECFWHVICQLVRDEVPHDMIAGIMLDPDLPISGHALDQKNPEGYIVRQLQRAVEYAEHPKLQQMNDKFFYVNYAGSSRIGWTNSKGELEFMKLDTFNNNFENQFVEVGTTKEGNPINVPLAKWWRQHPKRRQYLGGVTFDPTESSDTDTLNLWRGYSVASKPGNRHESWLKHVLDNICNGNEEHFKYLISWCARVVQQPATQSETSIVLRGKEGTGKNTFFNVFKSILGQHFFESARSEHFLGQFNSHLRDKVFIHANEAFFAGDKRHEAALKMTLTESTMPVEAKGVDVRQEPNYMHCGMSSNSNWVVPAGPDSRRYFVADVSPAKMQDGMYFKKISSDLANGGIENLFHFLLNYDLSDFNVRAVPVTDALIDQRIQSMPLEVQWWMECLNRGWVFDPNHGWVGSHEKPNVYGNYISHMQDLSASSHSRLSTIQFGMWFKKMGIETKTVMTGGARVGLYLFQELDTHRTLFDEAFGGPFEWSEIDPDVQGDIPF